MMLKRVHAEECPTYDETSGDPVKLQDKSGREIAMDFFDERLKCDDEFEPSMSVEVYEVLGMLLPEQVALLHECYDSYQYYSYGEIADANNHKPGLYEAKL